MVHFLLIRFDCLYVPGGHYGVLGVDLLTKLSLIIHNRELVVINDMDTFAHFYCYSTKQRPGEIIIKKDKIDDESEIGDSITPVIEFGSLNPITPDDDIL